MNERPMLLPALCPVALVVKRGGMLVMGTTFPLEVADEAVVVVVVVCPSLISMVRKVFISGSVSPWLSGCPAVLSEFLSPFKLPEACSSFSAGCLVPPIEFWDWLAEGRCLLATPPG